MVIPVKASKTCLKFQTKLISETEHSCYIVCLVAGCLDATCKDAKHCVHLIRIPKPALSEALFPNVFQSSNHPNDRGLWSSIEIYSMKGQSVTRSVFLAFRHGTAAIIIPNKTSGKDNRSKLDSSSVLSVFSIFADALMKIFRLVRNAAILRVDCHWHKKLSSS